MLTSRYDLTEKNKQKRLKISYSAILLNIPVPVKTRVSEMSETLSN